MGTEEVSVAKFGSTGGYGMTNLTLILYAIIGVILIAIVEWELQW